MVLTSRTRSVPLGVGLPLVIIGERINPTGKKQLTAELQAGQFTKAMEYAEEQVRMGAGLLDVNVGAPHGQRARGPARAGADAGFASPDPSLPGLLRPGGGSSRSGRLSRKPVGQFHQRRAWPHGKHLAPLCARYGAPCILLPLEGKDLPVTAKDRIEIIERMVAQAMELGLPKRLLLIDVLALTVSSKSEAAKACLETISYCANTLGLPTVYGLSNISFGLPARALLNSTFLTMSMAHGLAACIANPGAPRLGETLAAAEVLLDRDPQAGRFIDNFGQWTPGDGGGSPAGQGGAKEKKQAGNLHDAVILGDKENVLTLVEDALQRGEEPFEIVNKWLIPAITEVGVKYERREYYLPQLILSAETMQLTFERLRPLLEEKGSDVKKPVVVMATVEGDVHDIGKNIVNLMLRNHGFDVVDLGKNVPATAIVDAASLHGAVVIGLSALMTTTMVRMRDTIDMVREQGLGCKVMIGGAVITEDFAQSIGADGYATDAVAAVRVAERLSGL